MPPSINAIQILKFLNRHYLVCKDGIVFKQALHTDFLRRERQRWENEALAEKILEGAEAGANWEKIHRIDNWLLSQKAFFTALPLALMDFGPFTPIRPRDDGHQLGWAYRGLASKHPPLTEDGY